MGVLLTRDAPFIELSAAQTDFVESADSGSGIDRALGS